MRMRSPARPAAGFTLVEALVATALFSLVMLGTIPMFVRSISGVARNRNLMSINGGTQALIDELTVRYGINKTDPHITMPVGTWKVFNNNPAYRPTGSNSPFALQQLFLDPTGAALSTQTRMVGQLQYTVATLGTARVEATVELFYFKAPMWNTTMAGNARILDTNIPVHMAMIRQVSYIDQP